MNTKTYAIADYGTNSARLMIATVKNNQIIDVKKSMETIRLGEGMTNGVIAPAAMVRAKDTTLRFLKEASASGAEIFFGFATSAVRDAKNQLEFVDYIEKECDTRLDVISGDNEARIGYIGASRGSQDALGIIDIGGGSTEIIIGKNKEIIFAKSHQTGTVRLLQQFGEIAPNNLSKYIECKEEIQQIFSALPKDFLPKKWLSIGGTATSLAAVDQKLTVYNPQKVDGYILSKSQVENLFSEFSHQTVTQRKKTTGLQENRADVIVYGALILDTLLELLDIAQTTVSEADNLEGYLLEKLSSGVL